MKKNRSSGLWRGLTTTAASLLVISISVSSLANARAAFINARLGTTNYQIINTDSESDGIYHESEFSSLTELLAAKEEVATQLSAEGSVLLKNENAALPLDKGSEEVTLWGLNSANPVLGGLIGSSVVVSTTEDQTAYGIREALDTRNFTVNQDMMDFYDSDELAPYLMKASFFGQEQYGHSLTPAFSATYENPSSYNVGEAPPELYTDELLATADGTVAVVVISRDSSEAADYSTEMVADGDDSFTVPLALSDYEKSMIELAKQHSTKVVVLINADNPMELEELKNDSDIDAILWVGLPGMYGFLGVADILSGDANPSGHLSDTYAIDSTSAPAMANFGVYTYTNSSTATTGAELTTANKADWYVVENEGIYVGYKYYETRYEDSILGSGNAIDTTGSSTGSAWSYANEISYPFGYGLSYTTFEQELVSVEVDLNGVGTAVVNVTNTGNVAGKDVVQLYVQAPYIAGGVEKSAIQLLDFGKTQLLEPGASETVTIEFDPQYIASYDETAVKANGTAGAWVLDEGDYYFAVGNGAHEALNNVLANKLGSSDGLVTVNANETINAANALKWTLDERDIETFSVNVENVLQDCDINNLIPDTVEYTTRSDWTKGWETIETLTPTDEMMVGLTNNTYSLSANGDGVTWGEDNGLKLVDFIILDEDGNYAGVVDYDDPQWDLLMDQVTLEEAVNFIENAGDNDYEEIPSISQPIAYAQDGPNGFVYDQVAGYYVRWNESQSDQPTYVSESDEYSTYSMASMPTAPVVASTFNKELVEREGEIFGEDGLWANISTIIGPGMNLHRSVYCARNHEYYSEDSMLTNLMGVAVCTGGSNKGLIMQPKHLAFNHQEMNRSGMSTFFTEQAGRENELRGFQGAMTTNAAKSVMTAFNRVGTVFVGASSAIQEHIAREEWGYTGFYVTDMINGADYMNWKDNILGGGGGMLGNSTSFAETEWGAMTTTANMNLIKSDTEFQLKMKEIIKTYAYAIVSSNAMNGITSGTETVYVSTWWQNALLGLEIALGVATVGFGAIYILNTLKLRKRNG